MSDAFAPAGRLRAATYRLLWGCANILNRAGEACLHLAAGLLHQDDLKAASRVYWRRYGTSADDVDAGLELWERRLYGSLLRPSDRVLLVGCGAGRDLLALRELGYDVTGLDPTPELVARANEHLARRGMTANVVLGFVETADFGGKYDVVVLAGCCYCYVPRSACRVAALARIRTHLSESGRIAVIYSRSAGGSPIPVLLTRTTGYLTRTDLSVEHGDSFSRGYFAARLLRYEHLFAPDEVARECAEAGLRVIRDEVTTPFYYVIATASNAAHETISSPGADDPGARFASNASQTDGRTDKVRG